MASMFIPAAPHPYILVAMHVLHAVLDANNSTNFLVASYFE